MLGTKQYMTQIFDADGKVHAATVISAGPTTVTQIKTSDKDGYSALQLGAFEKKAKNVAKPQQGHFKKALQAGGQAGDKVFQYVRELRKDDLDADIKVGDEFTVADIFAEGDYVNIAGHTKGKGFQGVVKRHNFAGGPRTHGQKHTERSPGSIGGGLRTRVPRGMKMGGRMGDRRVTVKNLKVLAVNAEENLLMVEGAVPGRRGTMLEIRTGDRGNRS